MVNEQLIATLSTNKKNHRRFRNPTQLYLKKKTFLKVESAFNEQASRGLFNRLLYRSSQSYLHEWTVMIKIGNASIADPTVLRSERSQATATVTQSR